MKDFIIDIENNNLASYIKEVFYDSKASICSFEFTNIDDEISEFILEIALKHISQFVFIDNHTYHGSILRQMMEDEEEYYNNLAKTDNKS